MMSRTSILALALLAFSTSNVAVATPQPVTSAAAPTKMATVWYKAEPTSSSAAASQSSSSATVSTTKSSVVWYRADPSSSSTTSPTSTSTPSIVWFRADPATSNAHSSPAPSSPSPTYPAYNSKINKNGYAPCILNPWVVQTCRQDQWVPNPSEVCPEETLPDSIRLAGRNNTQPSTVGEKKLALPKAFLDLHGGSLLPFCGKTLTLIDPKNASHVSTGWYVVRACTEKDCPGFELGGAPVSLVLDGEWKVDYRSVRWMQFPEVVWQLDA
ncbi:hypothetical protein JCM10207_007165 [Rhodosporidiobolus poonsookiae]